MQVELIPELVKFAEVTFWVGLTIGGKESGSKLDGRLRIVDRAENSRNEEKRNLVILEVVMEWVRRGEGKGGGMKKWKQLKESSQEVGIWKSRWGARWTWIFDFCELFLLTMCVLDCDFDWDGKFDMNWKRDDVTWRWVLERASENLRSEKSSRRTRLLLRDLLDQRHVLKARDRHLKRQKKQ